MGPVTGTIPLTRVRRVALLTDGAARAVDPFGLFDRRGVLNLLGAEGPDALIGRVRQIERTDPEATRWPRNKASDDATVAFCDRIAHRPG